MSSANAAVVGQDATSVQARTNRLSAQGTLLGRLRKERANQIATFDRTAKSFDSTDAPERKIQLLAELESLEREITKMDREILAILSSLYRELG